MYMQHMVLSHSTRAHGGQSVHSVSESSVCVPTGHHELSLRVTVPYAACTQYILLKMKFYGSKHVEE